MNDTTQPPETLSGDSSEPRSPDMPALVLLWSRDEPARAGEVIVPPSAEPARTWTFGRAAPGDGAPRGLALVRQRPGLREPTEPLACPRISRVQLELSVTKGGALAVANVGRCPLLHLGRKVRSAELAPGDVVELENELVLLCARRPWSLSPLPVDYPLPLHPFGEPDALGLVGEGPAMWDLRAAIQALARSAAHVLVLGASGTGKELVARAIHARSDRGERPLLARSAATIPEALLDAELFGHAKNFPNAGMPERLGLIGEAAGSTLFLDELAELPAHLQAHLLRVLDEGEYHRLGEARSRRADLRLIAATNRPAQALKHDVLARFQGRVVAPDLASRREDIPLLARHLLRRLATSDPSLAARFFPGADPHAPPRMTPDLVTALVRHPYTTHVRQLSALLLRASIESRGKYLQIPSGATRHDDVPTAAADAPTPSAPRTPRPAIAASRAPAGPTRRRSSPAPAEAVAPPDAFTAEEERRLALQRKHAFQAAECARDPDYGAGRQTADLHLRQLMTRALAMRGWSVEEASSLLGGDDPDGRDKARRRLETFLFHLRRRAGEEGMDALRRALAQEWRRAAPVALALLDALASGKLHDPD